MTHRNTPRPRSLCRGIGILAVGLALLCSSCAFYNTFYFARKNYNLATVGLPYEVEKPVTGSQGSAQYRKAIDYSKKLIANYPTSKWVDDAYLLWARSLLGTNDPVQTISMLRDFSTRYPESSLKSDAAFYLGVAYRAAHKPSDALTTFDLFLELSPKHDLAPYAHLERARVLMVLKRPAEAAEAADRAAGRFKKGRLYDLSVAQRAEALLVNGDYDKARADYRALGARALTDEERFALLLKEADCLEAAREFDAEVQLLGSSLAHEIAPMRADTTRGMNMVGVTQTQAQSGERWGRLNIRIGTVRALQGHKDAALTAYHDVIDRFPRHALGAEAQYRIGYVYETVGDDFETARSEYGKVRSQQSTSVYAVQATQRASNLERLAQFRATSGDSVTKKAEGAFLLAEQYLFGLDKPDRAFAVYDSIAHALPGSAWAGKARTAQAWMLRTKYQKPETSDSLLWTVVHDFPATEAQLAARDYLEARGAVVPDSLIKLPEAPPPPPPPADTVATLSQPPAATPMLGTSMVSDSLGAMRMRMGTPAPSVGPGLTSPDRLPTPTSQDPSHAPVVPATGPPSAPPSPIPAPADTARKPAPADTTRR